MKSLKRKIRQMLPRKLRRFLSEKEARKSSLHHLDSELASAALGDVDDEWRMRIDAVTSCPNNAFITRVDDAGILRNGVITMHNGIRVGALGYYGAGILNMLVENRGVHEPQEERAFGEILKYVGEDPVMLELGAYWGFYSMWFLKETNRGKAYLVEPDARHVLSGKQNFELNGMSGVFESAYVANTTKTARDGTPTTTVDDFLLRHGVPRLSILHSDIQGAELEMLKGAEGSLKAGLIDFIFISTHSASLHSECLSKLKAFGFQILVSCDLEETVSFDGVIVAKRHGVDGPDHLEIEGNAISTPEQNKPYKSL